jgi:hypothetical protein
MLRPAHRARRHKTLDSIWVDAVASDRKWVRSARKGFEAPLRGFVAERARAVMGADSAITLDGQSRVAMGITAYALPRSASLAAKQKPRRTNVGADDELSGGGAVRQGSPSAIGLERRERVQAKLIVQRLDPLRHMHMDSSSTRALTLSKLAIVRPREGCLREGAEAYAARESSRTRYSASDWLTPNRRMMILEVCDLDRPTSAPASACVSPGIRCGRRSGATRRANGSRCAFGPLGCAAAVFSRYFNGSPRQTCQPKTRGAPGDSSSISWPGGRPGRPALAATQGHHGGSLGPMEITMRAAT